MFIHFHDLFGDNYGIFIIFLIKIVNNFLVVYIFQMGDILNVIKIHSFGCCWFHIGISSIFIFGMGYLVIIQKVLPREGFFAVVTLVWKFSCVHSTFVNFKVVFLTQMFYRK